jgi:8-oxo-dGTP pyrophosphatase MutT (NUDIX family)
MTEMAPVVAPRPAAALALVREGRTGGIAVFMVRRHVRSDFVPDVYVFPGGSVQESDRAVERTPGLCASAADGPTALGAGFRVAALRECFEEAGVLLAHRAASPAGPEPGRAAQAMGESAQLAALRAALNGGASIADIAASAGLTLATDALHHWSHWITPETFPKRFDTHFFLAAMPEDQEASHDRLETTDGIWIAPDEALARHEQGLFPLVFATVHQLRALAPLRSLDEARARFAGPVRPTRPYVVTRDGEELILLPDEP